ncbi:MAG TPA: hypothetical protein EYG92_10985 [Lutibacter sp.]|nr:hypothetical protein [Lutibacter sp.]
MSNSLSSRCISTNTKCSSSVLGRTQVLNQFKEDNLQITVIYDIYSFLYMPNYLAEAGFELIPLKDASTK